MNKLEIKEIDKEGEKLLEVSGRLDAYWADHLGNILDQAVEAGHYYLSLDLTKTDYISSAGIRLLILMRKKMSSINGVFYISEASPIVIATLEMVGMSQLIGRPTDLPISKVIAESTEVLSATAKQKVSFTTTDSRLKSIIYGDPALLRKRKLTEEDVFHLEFSDSMLSFGIGAIGADRLNALQRAGEFLTLGHTLMYKPCDGVGKPDYFEGNIHRNPGMSMLYGMSLSGHFSGKADFESTDKIKGAPLSELLDTWLDISGSEMLGIVLFAESAGVTAASVLQLNEMLTGNQDIFSFPEIRENFSVTTEPGFVNKLLVIVGIVNRASNGFYSSFLRPINKDHSLQGHFHAAVLPMAPLIREEYSLDSMVQHTLRDCQLLDVIHILFDDREIDPLPESSFFKGSCWFGPLAAEIMEENL